MYIYKTKYLPVIINSSVNVYVRRCEQKVVNARAPYNKPFKML